MLTNVDIGEGIGMYLCDMGAWCRPDHLSLDLTGAIGNATSGTLAPRSRLAGVVGAPNPWTETTIYNVWSGTHYGPT